MIISDRLSREPLVDGLLWIRRFGTRIVIFDSMLESYLGHRCIKSSSNLGVIRHYPLALSLPSKKVASKRVRWEPWNHEEGTVARACLEPGYMS
jgi:hypothetical protein